MKRRRNACHFDLHFAEGSSLRVEKHDPTLRRKDLTIGRFDPKPEAFLRAIKPSRDASATNGEVFGRGSKLSDRNTHGWVVHL